MTLRDAERRRLAGARANTVHGKRTTESVAAAADDHAEREERAALEARLAALGFALSPARSIDDARRVVAELETARVTATIATSAAEQEPRLDDEPELDDAIPVEPRDDVEEADEEPPEADAAAGGAADPPDGPGGFWRAPRRLRHLLEDGDVTAKGYALVHYVGEANGDRDGLSTTLAALAELLDLSTKQTRRTLERLVELDLLEHDLRAGRARFRVRLGLAAVYAPPQPRTRPRTFDPPSNVRGDVLGDLGHPSTPEAGKPASASGATSDTTSDISRARAETETETEKTPLTPQRGERRRRTPEQRRADRFAAKLPADRAATWQTLDPDTRATIAEAHAGSTGLRYRRGPAAGTWTNDPLGDHARPTGSEANALPPDWHGRATPAEYLQAWLERGRPETPA